MRLSNRHKPLLVLFLFPKRTKYSGTASFLIYILATSMSFCLHVKRTQTSTEHKHTIHKLCCPLMELSPPPPHLPHNISWQRKHQAMYDDFVKRKDMKREGYTAASLHSFSSSGGNNRYPVAEGPEGGGPTKFVRHDPRQVCVVVKPNKNKKASTHQMCLGVVIFFSRKCMFCTSKTSVTGVTLKFID